MIGFLQGKIIDIDQGRWIIGNEVGYLVSVPSQPAYLNFKISSEVKLYIHTIVREDALDLYGFLTKSEKELFLTFLSINGLGPKASLNLLSTASPGSIIDAIFAQDREALTSVPGIGKKTAERILLEAKDPLKKKLESGQMSDLKSRIFEPNPNTTPSVPVQGAYSHPLFSETKMALIALGYKDAEVDTVLQKLMSGKIPSDQKTEDWIKNALQYLGKAKNPWI
jgi:Holliday junction DNA helicase RuvA